MVVMFQVWELDTRVSLFSIAYSYESIHMEIGSYVSSTIVLTSMRSVHSRLEMNIHLLWAHVLLIHMTIMAGSSCIHDNYFAMQ
jgi:hypothetical protein